jgi:hypothetical protein
MDEIRNDVALIKKKTVEDNKFKKAYAKFKE